MSLTLPARRRLNREQLSPLSRLLSRLPLSRLLLRHEYMIALGRPCGLPGLREHPWRTVLTRDLVTDAVAEYIADPFLLRRGNAFYLYFEVLNLSTGWGELSVAHSSDLEHWSYDGVALRERCHLSYPYVFEHGGETYMVPETSERATVSLYRATAFPLGWEKVGDLLAGEAFVDTSLFHEDGPDGQWWLVTSTAHSARPRVYCAAGLRGPWTPVPAQSDADPTRLRSAGRIFRLGGQWYRPVQRQGQVYGEDVWLYRIELGAHGYRETLVQEVPQPLLGPPGVSAAGSPLSGAPPPGWNAVGMHHLDLQPDGDDFVAAVDGKSLILDASPRRALLRLRNKLFRIGR
ncbi:glucosamine inositolphosphorylceramide transferase family protein [Deinococcus koreensis]|uniref:Glucosamine inositolphosphorylceramide transferase 1 N-terminal domain-containing protein n=1 Tax=Deinococcus koreensis TaxID=2054903 RepID=A0A2K3UZ95_9DEIO|nr:family 43 glycosylhydrolase [Deinococcus koreensis]PNY81868.1 hypothetical protein CVO96_11220 [Deinococcus koreensis]